MQVKPFKRWNNGDAMKRKENGQFNTGNGGGPGRPKRAVELEYLAALSDVVPLDLWKKVCKRAADDASGGDAKAREWLTHYLIGGDARLSALARLDVLGISPGEMIAAEADAELHPDGNDALMAALSGSENLLARAKRLAESE
jgi:hypothetical protein